MRWKADSPVKYGDTKWVKRYAYFPTVVEGMEIWLEYYWAELEYHDGDDSPDFWCTIDRRLIENKPSNNTL
jgi:hypothetical protein